jgi:hypothetical protein
MVLRGDKGDGVQACLGRHFNVMVLVVCALPTGLGGGWSQFIEPALAPASTIVQYTEKVGAVYRSHTVPGPVPSGFHI